MSPTLQAESSSSDLAAPDTALQQMLQGMLAAGASDLHIAPPAGVRMRVDGRLVDARVALPDTAALQGVARAVTTDAQWRELEQHRALDMSYASAGERYRLNWFYALGHLQLAARHLDNRFRTFDELGLPDCMRQFAAWNDGLVLVTGATGCGKSTTLAALVHEINMTRPVHVLTIEDPVEFVHASAVALVRQRELHRDFESFAAALRAALREDPDVILVGELRDTETMRAAINAAETGHLVFATLHTPDAAGSIERLIGGFPPEEQGIVRHRLSLCLRAVATQMLLPAISGRGRVPAVEILISTPAVSNLIATGRSKQIHAAMDTGTELGMQTLDRALATLWRNRRVSPETALSAASNRDVVERLAKMALS